MDLYLKITEAVYIVFVLVVTLSSLAIPEGDDNGYNTVTMTALSPLAVSRDSDTNSDYESPQLDNFVVIGDTRRKRYPQPSKSCHPDDYSLY